MRFVFQIDPSITSSISIAQPLLMNSSTMPTGTGGPHRLIAFKPLCEQIDLWSAMRRQLICVRACRPAIRRSGRGAHSVPKTVHAGREALSTSAEAPCGEAGRYQAPANFFLLARFNASGHSKCAAASPKPVPTAEEGRPRGGVSDCVGSATS